MNLFTPNNLFRIKHQVTSFLILKCIRRSPIEFLYEHMQIHSHLWICLVLTKKS